MNYQLKKLESVHLVYDFGDTYLDDLLCLEKGSHGSPWSEGLFRAEFENDLSMRIGLVSEQGSLVAYVFNQSIEDELHVLNIVVSPEHRRKNYARLLLEDSIRLSQERGGSRALLEVRPSNIPALGLYRSLGFKVLAKRKSYYRDNQEDALMLSLDFPKTPQV